MNVAGDGFVVEFASVEDAVECALTTQSTDRSSNAPERRLHLRFGINLRDVLISLRSTRL